MISSLKGDGKLWDNYAGTCKAWAEAFQEALAINGIQANLCDLSCTDFEAPKYLSGNYTATKLWCVKTQQKNASNTDYTPTTPDDKVNKGQGGTHTQRAWREHTIVEYDGAYYDPSYGIKGVNKIDYEDKSIQGCWYGYMEIDFYYFQDVGSKVFDRALGTTALLNYLNR